MIYDTQLIENGDLKAVSEFIENYIGCETEIIPDPLVKSSSFIQMIDVELSDGMMVDGLIEEIYEEDPADQMGDPDGTFIHQGSELQQMINFDFIQDCEAQK